MRDRSIGAMRTFRNWQHEDVVDLVAILTADGSTQPEAAAILGISQASVSRLVKEAQRQGRLVVERPRCTLPDERVAELRDRVQSPLAGLLQAISPRIHEVHVGSSG